MKLFGRKSKAEPAQNEESQAGTGKKKGFPFQLTRRNKIIVTVCLVVVAVALTVTALATKYVRPPEPVQQQEQQLKNTEDENAAQVESDVVEDGDAISIEDKTHKSDFFTVLIVGTDDVAWNTDTIMLAAFDIATKKLNVLSIPRDTCVNVKRSNKKINAAYSVGGKAGNIEELYNEVQSVTGIRPDRYVIVALQGFIDMIDAIGGVTVDVPIDMVYRDPAQDLDINIKKGVQTLDGYDAMGFMRYRHSYVEGDIGRIKVQQTFVDALAKKMLQPSTLTKLPQLADIVMKNVKTDLSAGNIIWLGKEALNMNPSEDVKLFLLPGEGGYYKRLSYYFPYENATLEMVNEHFNPYVTPIQSLNLLDPRSDGESSSSGNSTTKSNTTQSKSNTTTKKSSSSSGQSKTTVQTPAAQKPDTSVTEDDKKEEEPVQSEGNAAENTTGAQQDGENGDTATQKPDESAQTEETPAQDTTTDEGNQSTETTPTSPDPEKEPAQEDNDTSEQESGQEEYTIPDDFYITG